MVALGRGGEYIVYADVDINRPRKKLMLGQCIVMDANGEVFLDEVGGPLGFYSGEITLDKMKLAVKWHIETTVEKDLGLKLNITLSNLELRSGLGINQVRERANYELYQTYKRSKRNSQ